MWDTFTYKMLNKKAGTITITVRYLSFCNFRILKLIYGSICPQPSVNAYSSFTELTPYPRLEDHPGTSDTSNGSSLHR
jgi:hypothetical protein